MAVKTTSTCGELTLAFTTDLVFRWNSEKTDGKYGGSFYHPVPPDGFYALGSVGASTKENDGNIAALCVQGSLTSGDPTPPLARPTGYVRVWRTKGMNGKYGGACWRPTAPSGYAALGHVFTSTQDTPPALDEIVCVRKDLAHTAVAGEFIYSDKNTDADHDFSAWGISPPVNEGDGTAYISSLGFVGVASHSAPSSDAALWVLNLPLEAVAGTSPSVPALTGYTEPAQTSTTPVVDRTVYVPFTAVVDEKPINVTTGEGTVDVDWQVAHTPFYTVRRLACYDQVTFYNNTSGIEQSTPPESVELAFSLEEGKTYTAEAGVALGYERGVSVGIEGSSTETKVSASLSISLGFSKEVYRQWTGAVTATSALQIPAATAAALYVLRHEVQLLRDDGTRVDGSVSAGSEGTSTNELPSFHENAFVAVQYPTTSSTGSVAMSVQMEEAEAVPLG